MQQVCARVCVRVYTAQVPGHGLSANKQRDTFYKVVVPHACVYVSMWTADAYLFGSDHIETIYSNRYHCRSVRCLVVSILAKYREVAGSKSTNRLTKVRSVKLLILFNSN